MTTSGRFRHTWYVRSPPPQVAMKSGRPPSVASALPDDAAARLRRRPGRTESRHWRKPSSSKAAGPDADDERVARGRPFAGSTATAASERGRDRAAASGSPSASAAASGSSVTLIAVDGGRQQGEERGSSDERRRVVRLGRPAAARSWSAGAASSARRAPVRCGRRGCRARRAVGCHRRRPARRRSDGEHHRRQRRREPARERESQLAPHDREALVVDGELEAAGEPERRGRRARRIGPRAPARDRPRRPRSPRAARSSTTASTSALREAALARRRRSWRCR